MIFTSGYRFGQSLAKALWVNVGSQLRGQRPLGQWPCAPVERLPLRASFRKAHGHNPSLSVAIASARD